MATGAYPEYVVQVSFSGGVEDTFRIGISTLGGTDTIADGFPAYDSFSGVYDDVSEQVMDVDIDRGREDTLAQFRAGRAVIKLHDPDGLYNPENGAGALAGSIVPMMPVRVAGIYPFHRERFDNADDWTLEDGNVVISGGKLTITSPLDDTTYRDAVYDSPVVLSDRVVQVKMESLSDTSRSSFEWRFIFYETPTTHGVMFDVRQGPTLRAYTRTGGSWTQQASITYVAADMQYMRFRESGGTLYWEYAPRRNGPWTELHSESTPIDTSSGELYLELGSGVTGAEMVATMDDLELRGPEHELMRGQVTSWDATPVPGQVYHQATIVAEDLYTWMSASRPDSSENPLTTGAAIGAILDAVQFTNPSFRSLDEGDTLPSGSFSLGGSVSALEAVSALLNTERGIFVVDKGGTVVYRDRHTQSSQSVSGTITADIHFGSSSIDVARIRNAARVTPTGGTVEEYVDGNSAASYGRRDVPAITSPYISQAQAVGLAQYLAQERSEPQVDTRAITLKNTAADIQTILDIDVGQRWEVVSAFGGGTVDTFVEAVKHEISPKSHVCSVVVSVRTSGSPFVFDSSTFDGTDVFSY